VLELSAALQLLLAWALQQLFLFLLAFYMSRMEGPYVGVGDVGVGNVGVGVEAVGTVDVDLGAVCTGWWSVVLTPLALLLAVSVRTYMLTCS
jgi:hypothetical protein